MARRGENIYKRKDGRYEGRYIVGRRADGKPKFGYIYAYSYSEVKSALILAKSKARKDTRTVVIGKGTLSEFLMFWLEACVKERVKPSTYARYFERTTAHIIPELGNYMVTKLTNGHVQCLIDSLVKKKLAPSTIAGIVGVLSSAMRKACEIGAASQNPCEKVPLPQDTARKAQSLNKPQQKALEATARKGGSATELAVFLSLYAGLRIGELCALRWRDIDLTAGTVTVRKTLQRIRNLTEYGAKTVIVETEPKSKTSYRTIPLQSDLKVLLRRNSAGMSPDDYVLGGTRQIEPRTLRARFRTIARKAGLDIKFHTLRHTYATRCLESNFDVQSLSELLGHANASITLQVYAHSVFEHKRQLVERMQFLS